MPRLKQPLTDKPSTGRGFLPDFCRIPMVFGVVLTAQLLAILLVLASPNPVAEFWERLGPLSLYVQLISLTAAAVLCVLRPALGRLRNAVAAVVSLLLLVLVAGVLSQAAFQLIPSDAGLLFPEDGFPGFLARSLGVTAIVGALLLRYLYLHYLWRRQVEAEAEAHFQTLQARIRPHFLFNSMNTIANVIHTDPRLADELLQDLADLFRAALAKGEDTATLAHELDLVRRYLHIEKQRLGERMRIEWDLEDLPGEASLPPLILQPLVENAVYHGVQPALGPGLICVGGRYRRGQVNLSVRNTLPKNPEANSHSSGNHMAMDNVRQRITAMYPGEGRVVESRVEGDYQVRLAFPYPWRER
ncbi:MAG: histidine kinase [Pseudomonadota bacterium]|nr:histidine kinase [Pseudomonadota bacterium]